MLKCSRYYKKCTMIHEHLMRKKSRARKSSAPVQKLEWPPNVAIAAGPPINASFFSLGYFAAIWFGYYMATINIVLHVLNRI